MATMYICLCNAVTDTDIEHAVLRGATDLSKLRADLGVSSGCGTCQDAAQEVIAEVMASAVEGLGYAA
jgi:bacterioferritin-associated ferredoxin